MSDIDNIDIQNKVYNFLDDLRESGEVNMFGAAVDLREEFGFDRSMSRELLSDWMAQYGKDDDDG